MEKVWGLYVCNGANVSIITVSGNTVAVAKMLNESTGALPVLIIRHFDGKSPH